MFQRKTTGSVVCPSCGSLVGVRDGKCYTCGRANPGLWGWAPALRQLGSDLGFVQLVIGACSVIYLLTLVVSGPDLDVMGGGMILGPSQRALRLFGMAGGIPVIARGEWWTVLSASWLHGGLIHILFNMMAVRNLGPSVANLIGASRTVILYTVAGACGFLLSSIAGYYFRVPIPFLQGAPFTVGASASIFGLIGALLHYGRKSGSSLIRAHATQYVVYGVMMVFLLPGVDNFAHLGGFLGGYATSAFLNPLTNERGDHMLVALGCIAASFLSVAYAVFYGLSIFR